MQDVDFNRYSRGAPYFIGAPLSCLIGFTEANSRHTWIHHLLNLSV